jgi:hypothetical protein
MSRTHGRLGGTDERAELDGPHRPGTRAQAPDNGHGPALTTGADPRLAGRNAPATSLLALQRSAGNAAVASLVGTAVAVQRDVTIGEMETTVESAPAAQQGATAAGAGQAVTMDGGTTTIHGGHVSIEAPMTEAHGVLRADTIIADSVVASSYTPGAGNVW